jgi:type IV secretory pathway VirB4 component
MTVPTSLRHLWPRRGHDSVDPGVDERLPRPGAVEVTARTMRFAAQMCASFAVTGYPREVGAGWLEPLLTYPGRLDVSLHIEPIPPQVAASRLRRQLARLEASARSDAGAGRLADLDAEAAADDAADLAATLARGHGRLFRVGLYLTVRAGDQDTLDAEVQRVQALTASLLLDAEPTTFRALQGWVTALPLGTDAIRLRRTFDTSVLAAAFPFTSPDLPAPTRESGSDTPVLYGVNVYSSGAVVWDRYGCDNYNSVVLARSGAGKSYFTKLEALRLLYHGVDMFVVDPEDEYARLTAAVGGARIALGARGTCLNPFDLPAGQTGDVLARRALFCQTLIATMLGTPLDPAERAALDRAVLATYRAAGITDDPRSWARPAPLLADLARTLRDDDGHADHAGQGDTDDAGGDPLAGGLADRLAPYVTGSHKELFNGPTTTRPDGHLVAFSLRDLPDELKAVGSLLALDAIWRHVADPTDRRKRLVIVDEGWLLMQQPAGAAFLYKLAKSARKHWAALSVVTQDAADLLSTDLGRAVVSNATTQVLLRQAPQAIDAVADAFDLSDGERAYLLSAETGDGLLCATSSGNRVAFSTVASPTENALITTDPAELARLQPDKHQPPGHQRPDLKHGAGHGEASELDDGDPDGPEDPL